jgi:DNA replication ATP-dependent helicase Dna2
MNVSFTRARSKLVIFGSRKTLGADELLAEFFELMDEQGWIFELPPDADGMHDAMLHVVNKTLEKRGASATPSADENECSARQYKKAKIMERVHENNGLLKGRPILQDLVNDNK